jgi:ribosome recycling factor
MAEARVRVRAMTPDEIEFECEGKMEEAADYLHRELRTVRTGRASAGLVEHLKIEVPGYGATMDLRELAGISIPEPTLILIKPFDPSTLRDIERGIEKSGIGITPLNDGKVIRLPIPALSGERRQQLVIQVRKMAEAQRVAVRNARRDANKHIDRQEEEGTVSEDDAEVLRERIQDLTKKYEAKIDEQLAAKTREIQEI